MSRLPSLRAKRGNPEAWAVSAAFYLTVVAGLPRRLAPPRNDKRAVIASGSEAIQKRKAVSAAFYLTVVAGLPRRLAPPRNDEKAIQGLEF